MSSNKFEVVQSTVEQANEAIDRVSAQGEAWKALAPAEKRDLVLACIKRVPAIADEWAATGCRMRGNDPEPKENAGFLANAYIAGPAQVSNWLWGAHDLYNTIAKTGKPPAALKEEKRPNGAHSVKTFPWGLKQSAFAGGSSGELHIENGKPLTQTNPEDKPGAGNVCAVMGAGNIEMPLDIIDMMFFKCRVVVFKANPVNERVGPFVEHVFQPLVERGFLAFLTGGIEIGQLLTTSDKIDELAMTGSCNTYDAIVFGPGQAKTEANIKVTKPFLAELGCVTPWIIVPGKWKDDDLKRHAEQIAACKMSNSAFYCSSPQVIITSAAWEQRDQFLKYVREFLAKTPTPSPYYPRSDSAYATQKKHLLEDEKRSEEDIVVKLEDVHGDKQQDPLFATDVSKNAFVLKNEAFCPVLSEIKLDTTADIKDFLPKAVTFANEELWGSLSGMITLDESTEKNNKDVLEKAIDDMQYGTIGINVWSSHAYPHPSLTWGAYPIHSKFDIQSGEGKYGNAFCFDNQVKCVYRGPFNWPVSSKVPVDQAAKDKSLKTAKALVNHWNNRGFFSLIGLAFAAK